MNNISNRQKWKKFQQNLKRRMIKYYSNTRGALQERLIRLIDENKINGMGLTEEQIRKMSKTEILKLFPTIYRKY